MRLSGFVHTCERMCKHLSVRWCLLLCVCECVRVRARGEDLETIYASLHRRVWIYQHIKIHHRLHACRCWCVQSHSHYKGVCLFLRPFSQMIVALSLSYFSLFQPLLPVAFILLVRLLVPRKAHDERNRGRDDRHIGVQAPELCQR